MDRLMGETVIVTGGGRGIGAAFCKALAVEGAGIIIADVIDGGVVAAEIAAAGGKARYVHTDLTSAESVANLLVEAERAIGPVNVLVNNAALFANLTRKPFLDLDVEELDKVMDVNVRGAFLCVKAVAPSMVARGRGKILNIASGTVFKGMAGMLHYVTSKGAIVAMTRCLARELGDKSVCVNAIAPGLTMTEAVVANPTWQGQAAQGTVATRAIKREQRPDDLIGALIFLCSRVSDFVTGQTLVVDGAPS